MIACAPPYLAITSQESECVTPVEAPKSEQGVEEKNRDNGGMVGIGDGAD